MKVKEEMNRLSVKISRIKRKKSKRNQISEKLYDQEHKNTTDINNHYDITKRIHHRRGRKHKNKSKQNEKKRK